MKKKGEEIEIGKENPTQTQQAYRPTQTPARPTPFFPSPRGPLSRARPEPAAASAAQLPALPLSRLSLLRPTHNTLLSAPRPRSSLCRGRPLGLFPSARGPFPIFSCSARSPRAQPSCQAPPVGAAFSPVRVFSRCLAGPTRQHPGTLALGRSPGTPPLSLSTRAHLSALPLPSATAAPAAPPRLQSPAGLHPRHARLGSPRPFKSCRAAPS